MKVKTKKEEKKEYSGELSSFGACPFIRHQFGDEEVNAQAVSNDYKDIVNKIMGTQQTDSNSEQLDRITSSVHTLAQCAVGVLSLMGTINVGSFFLAVELNNTIIMIITIIEIIIVIGFHYLFKIWTLPYVVEFIYLDEKENENIGLRNLICRLYDINNWKNVRRIFIEQKNEILKEGSIIRNLNFPIKMSWKPLHFGILSLIYLALMFEIVFFFLYFNPLKPIFFFVSEFFYKIFCS